MYVCGSFPLDMCEECASLFWRLYIYTCCHFHFVQPNCVQNGENTKTKLLYDDYLTSVYSCNHNLLDSMTFILLVFPFCFLHTIRSFPFLSIFQFLKIHFVVILLLLCSVNMKSKYPASFCCYRWRSNKNCFVFNFHTLGTWLQINPTDTCHLALCFIYFGRKAIGR